MTVEQARRLLAYAERGEVQAASYGLGSDGYPPIHDDVWVALRGPRTIWITPDGTERPT